MAGEPDIKHEYESDELEMTFRGLLFPDEELIWCASSKKGATCKERGLVELHPFWDLGIKFILAGAFFIVLAVWSKASREALIIHCVFMGTMIIVGLGYLVRIMIGKRRIEKGRYALTDKRVIAINGKSMSSIDLTEICRISIEKTAPAVGHITIYSDFSPLSGTSEGIIFYTMKGPMHIDDIIRRQIETARKKAGLPKMRITGRAEVELIGKMTAQM